MTMSEEECDRRTAAALEDVDQDNVIDHQAVQTWAESLSTSQPLPVPNRWRAKT